MTIGLKDKFDQIWVIDFEFSAPLGETPKVACLVAKEHFSGEVIRMGDQELHARTSAPFPVDERTLVVAFFSSAEWGCFLQLGWPLPTRIIDLFVEFKNRFDKTQMVNGCSLLGAMAQFRLDSIDAAEKEDMRQLAMRGGPYTVAEMELLLDYCETDVDCTERLFASMWKDIDLPRALLRGRYMPAVANMERNGIPIDTDWLTVIRRDWDKNRAKLISAVDGQYDVYDGLSFNEAKFRRMLWRENIPWPFGNDGRLKLNDKTFERQAKTFPKIVNLRWLRQALSSLQLEQLAVGADGRNRCLLSPFASRTSRNQPSNNKFIFGPAVWLRSLIRPPEGKAIAYIDWSNQELGIGAALSGDEKMLAAYNTGDPYLALAKSVKAVPKSATKKSHPTEREMYKTCSLGVQYGMTEFGLARSLNVDRVFARSLIHRHKETFPRFWGWSQANVDRAMLRGYLKTVFGWTIHVTADTKATTLANFPCQANGAEMMRLACCLATEAGIRVCCPVHDALLIEGDIDQIELEVEKTQNFMTEASRQVLGGFELRSDVDIIRYPHRYTDPRGRKMWETVTQLCGSVESRSAENDI